MEPQYNETSLCLTNFGSPSAFRYMEVPQYYLAEKKNTARMGLVSVGSLTAHSMD